MAIGAEVANMKDICKNERGVGTQAERTYDNGPMLVLDQFTNGYAKAELDALPQTVDSGGHDQCVEISCTGTDDESDQADQVAAYEEPTTAEQITQAAGDQEHCALGKGSGDVDPCCVLAWSNILRECQSLDEGCSQVKYLVDEGQNVGRQDQEYVCCDLSQTKALLW